MKNYGYFNEAGNEFVITEPTKTRRPWYNYLFNNDYYVKIDQFGRGMSQYQDGKGNWSLLCIEKKEFGFSGERGIYIRDNATNEYWDAGWVYTQKKGMEFETVVGIGCQTIKSSYQDIAVEWRNFVPVQDSVELWSVTVANNSSEKKQISVFPFFVPDLTGYNLPPGTGSGRYDSYVRAKILKDKHAVICINQVPWLPVDKYNSLMASDVTPDGYETIRSSFLGLGDNFSFPKAVIDGELSDLESEGNLLLSAMQFRMELEPGEKREINLCIGTISVDKKEHLEYIDKYASAEAVALEFEKRQTENERLAESICIETPDAEMNRLINYWVKQQTAWCAHFSRGWGKGYRDTLQDAQGYRFMENGPELAGNRQFVKYKEILMSALTHQYADGRGTRKWSPISRDNYNDAPSWLIFAVVDYIKESGDYEFLEQTVAFLDEGEATVFEHILQAARHMLEDRGKHGMVRMRYGDWNDGITGVGAGGEGESVMTTQMLYGNLLLLDEMCKKLNLRSEDGFTGKLREYAAEIYADINSHAWDGEYYCRAFDDEGNKVGAQECELGKMYVEPQAFGLSQGLASPEQAEKVLRSVEKGLEADYGCPLLYPSYQKYDPSVGRLTGHVPGIWENGGIYCHGTAFLMLGFLKYGYADKVYDLYRKLLASNPKNPSEVSGLEPYILTNCFVGPENPVQAGFARISWTTGTATWIFRDIVEAMFGIWSDYEGLTLNPCLPSEWTEAMQERFYRNKRFRIVIQKPKGITKGIISVILNGEKLQDNFVPLTKCKETNDVSVMINPFQDENVTSQ